VGHGTADDAAVYRIGGGQVLVQTVDFFTPVVDDPYRFGQIAAANALSDVYAMRARPVLALALAAFPTTVLPTEVFEQILRGGSDKVTEAGAVVGGGHSIDHDVPIYGLAVTGLAAEGMSGLFRRRLVSDAALEEVSRVMSALNRPPVDAMEGFEVHAATDVTGYGLLGHAHEMMEASGTTGEFWVEAVPLLSQARRFAARGIAPDGSRVNVRNLQPRTEVGPGVTDEDLLLLCDAQTSGGLLVALPEEEAERYASRCRELGADRASVVGRVAERSASALQVFRTSRRNG
jgi:selenide,water dikinase